MERRKQKYFNRGQNPTRHEFRTCRSKFELIASSCPRTESWPNTGQNWFKFIHQVRRGVCGSPLAGFRCLHMFCVYAFPFLNRELCALRIVLKCEAASDFLLASPLLHPILTFELWCLALLPTRIEIDFSRSTASTRCITSCYAFDESYFDHSAWSCWERCTSYGVTFWFDHVSIEHS